MQHISKYQTKNHVANSGGHNIDILDMCQYSGKPTSKNRSVHIHICVLHMVYLNHHGQLVTMEKSGICGAHFIVRASDTVINLQLFGRGVHFKPESGIQFPRCQTVDIFVDRNISLTMYH